MIVAKTAGPRMMCNWAASLLVAPERIRLVFSSSTARTSSSLLPSNSHVASLSRHFFRMADSVQSGCASENLARSLMSSGSWMSERSDAGGSSIRKPGSGGRVSVMLSSIADELGGRQRVVEAGRDPGRLFAPCFSDSFPLMTSCTATGPGRARSSSR